MNKIFFFVFFKKTRLFYMEVIFLVCVLGPAVAYDYILSSLYLNYANNVVDSILCSFKYPSFLVLQYMYVYSRAPSFTHFAEIRCTFIHNMHCSSSLPNFETQILLVRASQREWLSHLMMMIIIMQIKQQVAWPKTILFRHPLLQLHIM